MHLNYLGGNCESSSKHVQSVIYFLIHHTEFPVSSIWDQRVPQSQADLFAAGQLTHQASGFIHPAKEVKFPRCPKMDVSL